MFERKLNFKHLTNTLLQQTHPNYNSLVLLKRVIKAISYEGRNYS